MSWTDYVSNMKDKGANQSGVYTLQGAVCAQTDGFNVTPAEIVYIKAAMDGGDNTKVTIGGNSCTMIAYDKDDSTFMAKTRQAVLSDSKVFFHAECSKHYMIIAGKTGAGERAACSIAHDISTYLKGLGQ